MRFDLNEVAALLHIHKAAEGHPKLKALSDSAMAQLESMAKEQAEREQGDKPPEPAEIDGSVHVPDEANEPTETAEEEHKEEEEAEEDHKPPQRRI